MSNRKSLASSLRRVPPGAKRRGPHIQHDPKPRLIRGAEQMCEVVQGLLRQRRVALVRDGRLPQKSPVEEHGPMGCARGVHASIDQQSGNAGDPSVVHGGNKARNILVVGGPRPDGAVKLRLPTEGVVQQIPQPAWVARPGIQRPSMI